MSTSPFIALLSVLGASRFSNIRGGPCRHQIAALMLTSNSKCHVPVCTQLLFAPAYQIGGAIIAAFLILLVNRFTASRSRGSE